MRFEWPRTSSVTRPDSEHQGELSARMRGYGLELFGRYAFGLARPQLAWVGVPLDEKLGKSSQPASLLHLSYTPSWEHTTLLAKAAWVHLPLHLEGFTAKSDPEARGNPFAMRASYNRWIFVAEAQRQDDLASWLGHRVTIGLEGSVERLRDATIDLSFVGQTSDDVQRVGLWSDATVLVGSAYLFDEWRILDRVSLSGGLRFNAATENFYDPVVLFKGDLLAQITRSLRWKVNYDEGLRPPTYEAVNGETTLLYQVLPNPRVERSRVISTQIAFERAINWSVVDRLRLTAAYSHIRLFDLIGSVGVPAFSFSRRFTPLSDTLVTHAFDGEGRLWLDGQVEVWGAATHQIFENFSFLPFVQGPPTTFLAGARWQLRPWIDLTVRGRLHLPYRTERYYRTSAAYTAEATVLDINANRAIFETPLAVDVSVAVGFHWRSLLIQVAGYNLFDNRVEDVNQATVAGATAGFWPAEQRLIQVLAQYTY